ncbi:3-oxoacyl-ACP reductase FabG [Salinisphaera hydrothermalis]|uniref:3-oxoacyl-[acyl-carrier-protein] reductase n=1 Tax=Salinisphaera hydrothermalis (strain C41B8) TaxID=1304275 RepID=A0A084IQH2_SALHC|nr:3-oxoacyl-ACP reductase FabG [Salinisphaera hydrothermalis]KEZ78956.1 3-oxoacyl-ACP reductase [Salinisphaera hydrothermalis C41B8]
MSSNALSGQIALVTGASRGIGAAIADRLAADGATVIGTATSEKGAAAIDERLGGYEPAGAGRVLDVTDAAAVEALIKEIGKDFGAPTIVVNNAAITRDTLMMRMKDEDWQAVIDANLSGVFRVSKAVLKGMMKARTGRIVNVGSVVGLSGNAGQVNYSAAKAGLLGLTRSMAREVGSRAITVNAVAPGFIETDMTRDLPESTRETMLGQIPLGRLGAVDDVAAAVAFLVSPAAGYITGETLSVNGGLYMGA